MGHVQTRWLRFLVIALGIWAMQSMLLGEPGFGTLRKRKIGLQVRRPALVRLANTTIAFKASATNQEYTPPLASLEATLETELVGNEKTLVKKAESEAEWVLRLRVTGYSLPQPQRRTQNVGKASTVLVHWTGTLNVAYEAVDRGGHVHDADNVSTTYDREVDSNLANLPSTGGLRIPGFGGGKPETLPRTAEDVKQIMIKAVVQQIATNLGNTTQEIEAQLAAGEDHLNRSADFMERRLWTRAIEELEKTPEFAKPEDESYRQYSLGLAYEAVSYDSKNYNDQRANLFKAQEYYDKATELNRKEKYFIETVARTKEAVARYRTLDAQQKEDSKKSPVQTAKTEVRNTPAAPPAAAPPAAAPPAAQPAAQPAARQTTTPAPAPAAPKGKAKTVTINDVIEMHAASVPKETIFEVIRNSPVDFNPIDVSTVLAIQKAKLPVDIQNELRRKVGAAPVGQTAPAAAPAPATPSKASPRPSAPPTK